MNFEQVFLNLIGRLNLNLPARLKRYKFVLFDLDPLRRHAMFKGKLYYFFPATRTIENHFIHWQLHRISKTDSVKSESSVSNTTRFLMSLPHPTTGIGHSFSEWNTGRIIAEICGIEFLHTSLPKQWEAFLHLQFKNRTFSDIQHLPNLRIIHLPYFDYRVCDPCTEIKKIIDSIQLNQPILFILALGQNLNNHALFIDDLRARYFGYSPHTEQSIFSKKNLNSSIEIAVHIRRGDVDEMKKKNLGNWQERYVDLEYFENLVKIVSQVLTDYSFNIKIFSQGDERDFHSFLNFQNTALFINYDQNDTLAQMINSDVLILSPSGFSFMAGLFSRGLKLAKVPWWHLIPETQDWCQISIDPWKDYFEIERKLKSYFLHKA